LREHDWSKSNFQTIDGQLHRDRTTDKRRQ